MPNASLRVISGCDLLFIALVSDFLFIARLHLYLEEKQMSTVLEGLIKLFCDDNERLQAGAISEKGSG